MQSKNLQVEIVDYDKSYDTSDEVKNVFYKNFLEMQDARKFKGLYKSMLSKYGKLAYPLIIAPTVVLFLLFQIILTHILDSRTTAYITSLIIAMGVNYSIFAYLLNKVKRMHDGYAIQMRDSFDIDKKYRSKGGNFLLAVINDSKTQEKEVVGTLGFRCAGPEERKLFVIKDEEAKIGVLDLVGVLEKYRGLGISKKLVDKAISFAEANNYDSICLGVFGGNDIAIDLYKKYGFRIYDSMEIERFTGYRGVAMIKHLKTK